jgi:hypothetical protein
MKTQKLNIGDLVLALDGTLGMIEGFDMGFISYQINWFGFKPANNVPWETTQRHRSRYLDYREKLK